MRQIAVFCIGILLTFCGQAMGQSFLGQLYEQTTWSTGSWVEYEVESTTNDQTSHSQVKISILPAESSSESPLYWIEIATRNEIGDVDKMKVKMPKVSRQDMGDASPLKELIVQHNDAQPVRLTLDHPVKLPNLDVLRGTSDSPDEQVQDMGRVQIETTGGLFTCQQIQKSGTKLTENPTAGGTFNHETLFTNTLWLSDQVCTGVVKGQDQTETVIRFTKKNDPASTTERDRKISDITYTLIAHGKSGAESEITGTPRNLSAPPLPPGSGK